MCTGLELINYMEYGPIPLKKEVLVSAMRKWISLSRACYLTSVTHWMKDNSAGECTNRVTNQADWLMFTLHTQFGTTWELTWALRYRVEYRGLSSRRSRRWARWRWRWRRTWRHRWTRCWTRGPTPPRPGRAPTPTPSGTGDAPTSLVYNGYIFEVPT